jgi:TolB-like protein
MDFLFNDLGEQTVKDNKFHAFDVVIDDSHKRTVKTKSKSKVPLIAAIVGILVLGIGGYAYYNNTLIEQPEEEKKVARDNLPIILVKPFRNLQAPNDSELSISDAITETLITGLQQYSEIVTLSSSTSYHVATSGLSNAQIRQTYGVDYLVTGSVQKSNTKIRVTSELNNLTNNRVEWSKKFDFTNDDLFEIQDKINNKILAVLQIKTVIGEGSFLGTSRNEGSIESYTLMLNIRRDLRLLSPESWQRADNNFKELINSDLSEEFKMVMSVWHRVVKIFTGQSDNMEKDLKDIIEFSDKSLELSKNEGTYTTRAFVEANLLKNCEKALVFANLANPIARSGTNLQFLGLVFTGCNEFSKGITNLEQALLKTPNDTDLRITKNLMSAYLISNKLKEAITLGEKNLNKNDAVTYILLAYAEAKQGNVRKATGYIDDQKKFPKPMSKEIFDRQFSSLPNRDFVKNLFSELKKLGLED